MNKQNNQISREGRMNKGILKYIDRTQLKIGRRSEFKVYQSLEKML